MLGGEEHGRWTYGNAVGVLLTNAFGFCLALLEGVLVLELGTHDESFPTDGCLGKI